MVEIATGTIVFAAIGAAIVGAVGWATRSAKLGWLDAMLGDMEDRINDVNVYQLTEGQANDLLRERKLRGDVMDASGVFLSMSGEYKKPSDVFKFTMHSDDGRIVIWHQRMPKNEFLIDHFQVGGSRERAVALEYKKRLKQVGSEAYVMWKMSQL